MRCEGECFLVLWQFFLWDISLLAYCIIQTLPRDAMWNSQQSTAMKLVQMRCQVLLSSTGKSLLSCPLGLLASGMVMYFCH